VLNYKGSALPAQRYRTLFNFSDLNPPTPPGSTGCESASGSPLSPQLGIQVVLQGGGVPPEGPPPVISTGLLHEVTPPWVIILSAQKAPAGRPSIIPKKEYMTLGPKFFSCSKMTVTRRRKHLFQ